MKAKDLYDDITMTGDQADIDFSKKGGDVSTKFGKSKSRAPFVKKIQNTDMRVQSLYKSGGGTDSTSVLKAIKAKKTKPEQYEKLMTRSAVYAVSLIKKWDIDVIIMPESSSTLTQDFVNKIVERMPHIKVVPNAAAKTENKDEILIVDDGTLDAKTVKTIQYTIDKSFKDHGKLEMKKFWPQFRKYIKNHMTFKNGVDVLDQTVLIVDDVVTSGATIAGMKDKLNEMGAKEVHALTLFK